MSGRKILTAGGVFAACIGVASIAAFLLGIWTGDHRWTSTGYLGLGAVTLAVVAALVAGGVAFVWDAEGME